MTKKIWFIPLFIIIALIALNLSLMGNHQQADRLFISGNIELTEVQASFKLPGRVEKRFVDEGDIVVEGQLIASLDAQELEQEMSLRQSEVAANQAALLEATNGYLPEEVAQAEARLESTQSQLDRLEADFKRQEDLLAKEVISQKEYDASFSAYKVAKAQAEEAKQALGYLTRGIRPEKIDQSKARLQQSEEALAIAKTRLSYAALHSAIGGFVLSKSIEAGEYVNAGTPIVTVGNLYRVWLRGYIDESDLGIVKIGQKVLVKTDSYPEKTYEGTIVFISAEAEFTPKNIQTQKERVKLVYRVKVDIDNPYMELKPGMPADGEIILSAEE